MKKLCARAGVDAGEVFPHNLRHLFATALYRAYKDILTLGDYVISCYGAEDLVDQFSEKVTEAFTDAAVVCDEAIA